MPKKGDSLHRDDVPMMRRIQRAVDRYVDVKAKRTGSAQRSEARRIKAGLGASFLDGGLSGQPMLLGAPPGGGHTDLAGAGVATTGTSPPLFLPNPSLAVDNTQVVWSPQSGPQYHFIHCPVTDVVFGGARGGGKSDALIGDAAIRAGRYGKDFRGLFLRRQQTELANIKQRMTEIYTPIGAKWSEQHQTWTFPGGGTLVLKYLMNDDDALMYKGWNITALYVDEIGDFGTRRAIDLLWGAMRSARGVPVVRRMSCNPGGPGHLWVKQLYLSHGKYRVFRYTPNPELPEMTIDAVFIPSRLEDNKILTQNDPLYETRLSAACGGDMMLYRAWREGDWDGLAGAYFAFDEKVHVATPPPIPPYLQRWLAIDWGYTHPTAVLWGVDFGDRAYIYRERTYTNTEPVSLGMFIAEVNGDDPVSNVYLSPDAFAKRTSVNTIATELEEGFRRAHEMKGLALIPSPEMAFNDRVNGWQILAAGFMQGRLLVSPSCTELIRTLPSMVRDPKKPNDVQKVDGDDVVDCARYLWATRNRGQQVSLPVEVRAAQVITAADPNFRAMQERRFLAAEGGGEGVTIRGRRRFFSGYE